MARPKPTPVGTEIVLAGLGMEPSDVVKSSVDQAEAAFERAGDLAHSSVQTFDAAASALKANATEMQLKAIEIAQTSTVALFTLARELLAARDPGDILALQQRFWAGQMRATIQRTAELNALALKLAGDAAKPAHDAILKSFDELERPVA